MNIFLKEKDFCDYLQKEFPNNSFTLGHSLITISMRSLKPVMSCVYIDDFVVAAAKYNQQFGFFTDKLLFEREKLKTFSLSKNGLNKKLIVIPKEKLSNGNEMVLTMNFSPLTGTRWHKRNLKSLEFTCNSI